MNIVSFSGGKDSTAMLLMMLEKLWAKLEEMNKKSFRKFRSDYTVQDLSDRFANENL